MDSDEAQFAKELIALQDKYKLYLSTATPYANAVNLEIVPMDKEKLVFCRVMSKNKIQMFELTKERFDMYREYYTQVA